MSLYQIGLTPEHRLIFLDTFFADPITCACCRERGNRGWKPEWSLIKLLRVRSNLIALGVPMGGRARGAFGLAGAPSVFQPSLRSPTRLEAGVVIQFITGAAHERTHLFPGKRSFPDT